MRKDREGNDLAFLLPGLGSASIVVTSCTIVESSSVFEVSWLFFSKAVVVSSEPEIFSRLQFYISSFII